MKFCSRRFCRHNPEKLPSLHMDNCKSISVQVGGVGEGLPTGKFENPCFLKTRKDHRWGLGWKLEGRDERGGQNTTLKAATNPVVLTKDNFLPKDIGQCLETFLIVTTLYYWYLVGRHSATHGPGPHPSNTELSSP